MTYQDLEDYYKRLQESYDSKKASFHYNSDRSHNVMIVRLMLDNSSRLDMFCGQLSIFREGFFKKIRDTYTERENQIEDISAKLKDALTDSIKRFLKKENAVFNVIFENYKKEYLNDLICDELSDGIREGKINLYQLDDKLPNKEDLYHFAYTDSKIIRLEQDKEQHNAICTINDTKHGGSYPAAVESYSQLRERSFAINVPE